MPMNQYPNGPVPPSRQTGMMKGREGYPDASQMPEIDDSKPDMSQAPADMKENNPVVQALQTLQQFVAAKMQAKDPQADTLRQSLLGFVQAIAGGAAGAPAEGQPAEGAAPEGAPGAEKAPMQMGEGEESPEDMAEDQAEGEAGAPAAPKKPLMPMSKGAFRGAMGRMMSKKEPKPFI